MRAKVHITKTSVDANTIFLNRSIIRNILHSIIHLLLHDFDHAILPTARLLQRLFFYFHLNKFSTENFFAIENKMEAKSHKKNNNWKEREKNWMNECWKKKRPNRLKRRRYRSCLPLGQTIKSYSGFVTIMRFHSFYWFVCSRLFK